MVVELEKPKRTIVGLDRGAFSHVRKEELVTDRQQEAEEAAASFKLIENRLKTGV